MMPIDVGQKAEMSRAYSGDDVAAYIALGGHGPETDAVPAPLINSMFSYLLGVRLPGQGTNYLKQESGFFETAKVGEMLTASVEVTRLRPEKHLADLRTRCVGEHGRLISEGRALVYIEDVEN